MKKVCLTFMLLTVIVLNAESGVIISRRQSEYSPQCLWVWYPWYSKYPRWPSRGPTTTVAPSVAPASQTTTITVSVTEEASESGKAPADAEVTVAAASAGDEEVTVATEDPAAVSDAADSSAEGP